MRSSSSRFIIAFGFAALVAIAIAACSSPTPPSNPTPTVLNVLVSGAAPAIGEGSQPFTATAMLSNSTSQVVTGTASWQSSDVAVATVAAGGQVQAVAPGDAEIRATYQSVSGGLRITVVAPRTYTLSGVLNDSSTLRPIVGAVISVTNGPNAGRSASTDGNGYYSIAGLRAGTFTMQVVRAGYTTLTLSITLAGDLRSDISLPPSGGSTTLTCGASTVPAIVDCPNNQGRQPPTARCDDGTFSCSQSRSGTCSTHGGVSCWVCPGVLCNPLLPSGP